jgi:protein-tyrosine phosphatase
MVSEGAQVLVTCRMGKNRSGLVSALALHLLTGQSGKACIQHIQSRRKGALRNPGFNECLVRLQSVGSGGRAGEDVS